MPVRQLLGALLVTLVSAAVAAQNANPVVAAAAKAMGADTLNSITYSGTARTGPSARARASATRWVR